MPCVIVYTFFNWSHITYKIVRTLRTQGIDTYYLGNFLSLEKHIISLKPTHILGLGDFRKDSKMIRIEQTFTNKTGNHMLDENGQYIYRATWQLEERVGTTIVEKSFGGPCNRSAYRILRCIEKNNLSTKFAFVHIPSSYSEASAIHIVSTWLTQTQ